MICAIRDSHQKKRWLHLHLPVHIKRILLLAINKRCQEKANQRKTYDGQGCSSKPSTLKPSSLASVRVNYWKIAVFQGLNVPSPGMFVWRGTAHKWGPTIVYLRWRQQTATVCCWRKIKINVTFAWKRRWKVASIRRTYTIHAMRE